MIKRRVLVVYLHSSKCPFLPIESEAYYYDDEGGGGDDDDDNSDGD